MSKDQTLGALLLIGAIAVIIIYTWLIFLSDFYLAVLQLTAFIAVVGVLCIVAWIGYTMATTPPPEPIEFEEPIETQEAET